MFFKLLEQAQMTWDHWAPIQDWFTNAVEGLRCKRLSDCPPNKKQKQQHGGQDAGQQKQQQQQQHPQQPNGKIEGLDIMWMRQNQVCIKYQTGSCPFTADHNTLKENVTLKHVCGGCLLLQKPTDKSHGARNCPNKSQFFGQ
jgi:hypothetical protein